MMFEHILIPLDSSSLAECVLPHASALARAFDAQVTVLTVLESARQTGGESPLDPVAWHMRRAEAQRYLDSITARFQRAGIQATSLLREGDAAQQVGAVAVANQVRLIVLSSHGQGGLDGWPISSVAEKIVLRAHTAMLIVQAYQTAVESADAHYHRLLVPLDGSQRAECVLPAAILLAEAHEAELLLAHVVRPPELLHREPLSPEDAALVEQVVARNQHVAASYLEQLRTRLLLPAQTRLVTSDNVPGALAELVQREHADLLVMSAHGTSGVTAWPYGSITTTLIANATTPLLIIQDLASSELELSAAELAAREHGGH